MARASAARPGGGPPGMDRVPGWIRRRQPLDFNPPGAVYQVPTPVAVSPGRALAGTAREDQVEDIDTCHAASASNLNTTVDFDYMVVPAAILPPR